MADTQSQFAQSDAYISELIREVRTMPAEAALTMGRRSFFELAGASAAGLILGFHLGGEAFADTATQSGNAANDQRLHSHRPRQYHHHLFQIALRSAKASRLHSA